MQPSRGEVLPFRRRKFHPKTRLGDAESGNVTLGPNTGEHNVYLQNKSTTESPQHPPDHTTTISTVPRQTSGFYWKFLGYRIKTRQGSREILRDIDGWVVPGTLTALMGPTGAGKTTPLDVLSSRTTVGVVTGESTIVEQTKCGSSFQRMIGYAQQQDIHLPSKTVREALEFSAVLRQAGDTPSRENLDYVETILQMLNMESYANSTIGIPGEGLSAEQRKRLTIAVEMVAKPDLLLFLDEPTSGLDSQTVWSICSLLRKLANNGQSILCTIHQPSAQLFCMFDHVGPDASTLISYFEDNGAPQCQPEENPAEWMMNFAFSRQVTSEQNWAQKWQLGEPRQSILTEMAEVNMSRTSQWQPAADGSEYATSFRCQLYHVAKRIIRDQYRDGTYLYTKVTLSVGLAFINGVSFLNTHLSIQGLTSILFSSFLLLQMFGSVGQLVTTRLAANQDLFESCERSSKMYSWYAFLTANLVVELFWQLLISIPMFVVWFYPTGLQRNGDSTFGVSERGALVLVLIVLFNIWSFTLCQIFAASISNPGTALQIATLCYWLSLTFCGVIVSPNSLPAFWVFMYRVSPLTYFVQGIAVAGLANTSITCSPVELIRIPETGGYLVNPGATDYCEFCQVSNANSFLASLGVDTRYPWHNATFLSVYVGFNIVAIFLLYRWSRVRRSGE
ncbi:hypothetical protein HD806DRAFT_527781 [Xylariaceae sp. AK1471]|nr:hypothetical protein HD806DRAFT_527781 [Xylariaceae sp. AK1471]